MQMSFQRKSLVSYVYSDKVVFQFSQSKQPFSNTQLKENLLKLLSSHAEVQDNLTKEDIFDDPEALIYRRIEHLFSCDVEVIWFILELYYVITRTRKELSVVYDEKKENFE